MAGDRTVSVTLRAQVTQYLAEMKKASESTRQMGSEAEKLAQKKEAFDVLGKASLAVGIAAATGVAVAVAKFAEYDQAMSNVRAATIDTSESTAETTARMDALGAAALEAGASTVFSATESANAIEELAKAGLSTADILGGALTGSLDLASAGQLGVARAAEISATALQQYNLAGNQAGHVADVLAAGAGKAMGSVEDLANGLKFVGPVANSMGISLEATTGVLALFAQQGIIGEQAGTSLRGVLSSLTAPSGLAAKEIEKLGITLYDSSGKFLGMENAAGELSKAYSGMDDASRNASMGVIFGRETITAATTLYQAGAEGVAEWTEAVDDSGYAAQVARDRLDNLAGDVEALGGAFDTALIQTGAAGNDVLRAMTQTLTDVIDLYNDAPEPVKAATLAVLAVGAAATLAGGAFFLGAPKVAAFNAALATMGPAAQKAGAALTASAGPVGVVLAAAGVALAIFAGEQANAKARTDAFTDTLAEQNATITDSTTDLVKANLAAEHSFLWMSQGSAFDAAEKLGISLDDVTEAALGNEDALQRVKDAYAEVNTGSVEQVEAYRVLRDVIDENAGSLSEAQRKQLQMNKAQTESVEAQEESVKATEDNAAALEVLAGKAGTTGDEIDELAATIRGFADQALGSRDAARALEESYDTLEASIKENGATLDITNEKGRANEAALDGIARAAKESAAATLEQTGSQEEANAVLQKGREKLIAMLAPFGIVGDAANAYADELGLIPVAKETAIKADTAAAREAIRLFVRDLNNIPGRRDVVINQVVKQTGAARGAVAAAYATGGFTGFGGKYEPAGIVHKAEFVSTAETTANPYNRAALEFMHSGGVIRGYADGGYVDGRNVQYASSGGRGSTSVNVSPAVSLAGATIVMSVDGRQMTAVIQDQIVSSQQSSDLKFRRGRQQ